MQHENDKTPIDGDTVAKLVRLAGRRATASEAGTRRAREAARTDWRRTARRNPVRRAWLAAASVAAAVLILLLFFAPPSERQEVPAAGPVLVEAVIGEALLERDEGSPRETLVPGRALSGDLALSTSRSGRTAIRLASGHSLRLDGESLVRLGKGGQVELLRGALYLSSPSGSTRAASLEVRTPLGSIREIGTQFEARLVERALRVRLREGEVVFRHGAKEQRIGAGSELVVREDGTTERAPIAPHDPEWDWILSVAPIVDIEGKTALDFLKWFARERGLTLVFSDEGSRAHAARTVLSGRAGSLGVERALDAVLPAAALDHRIADGRLYVSIQQR